MLEEEKKSIIYILNEYEALLKTIDLSNIIEYDDKLLFKSCLAIRNTLELIIEIKPDSKNDKNIINKVDYLRRKKNYLYKKYKFNKGI